MAKCSICKEQEAVSEGLCAACKKGIETVKEAGREVGRRKGNGQGPKRPGGRKK